MNRQSPAAAAAEARDAQAEVEAREKARAKKPVIAFLLDTLIVALDSGKLTHHTTGYVSVKVVGLEVALMDDNNCDYTDDQCREVLTTAGLLGPKPAPAPVAEKVKPGTEDLYVVTVNGVPLAVRAHFGATPEPTHIALLDGREVARFAARNDHHATNKARKIFGQRAQATTIIPETKVDPWARVR